MEEFKDIDAEIMRLKEELTVKDENLKQVRFPASGDYWRSRLDEERVLWEKRTALAAEERKVIEKKLNEQNESVNRYNQSIREMERKLENDTKLWEERLRLKEADVLIEKNRLFCETRIKEIEFEKNKLTEKVAELSVRIDVLRDEQLLELDKQKQHAKQDAAAYEDKLKAAGQENKALNATMAEVENALKQRVSELEAMKEEYRIRLEKTESAASENLQMKISLEDEIKNANSRHEAEKSSLKDNFERSALRAGENIGKYLGLIAGFSKLVMKHGVTKNTFFILEDAALKAVSENEKFAREHNLNPQISEDYKVLLCMGDEDAAFWESALSGSKAVLHKATVKKEFIKEIAALKPRVAVVSANNFKAAKKIGYKWPFLPVVLYGELKQKDKAAASKAGLSSVNAYSSADEMLRTVNNLAAASIALPEYWGKVSVKRPRLLPVAAAGAVLIAAAVFLIATKTDLAKRFERVSAYPIAYNQLSNITFDGKYLWACDWFGQSVYKHDPDAGLKLVRIFCFPGKHFTAVTWAGGYLWTADAWDHKIYKHNTDGSFTILETFDAPGTAISGLTFDGKNLWSCDASAGMVYRHAMDSELTVEDAYESPGANPSGIFYDGKNLWSVDSKINRIYRHKMDATLSTEASYIPPLFDQKNYNLTGIAIKGDRFWVCSEKLSKVFSFPKERMELVN